MSLISDPDPSEPQKPATHPARQKRAQVANWMLGGLFVLALAAVLRSLASVAVPVVFAILITLVVAPLHAKMQQRLRPRFKWLAHVAIMLLLTAIVVVFLGALFFAAQRVLEAMPSVGEDLASLTPFQSEANAMLGERLRELWVTLGSSIGNWITEQATTLARTVASMTGVFFTALVLIFFLILLALTERSDWRGKIHALWPGDGEDAWATALGKITQKLRRFLVVRTVVGLLQAALYVAWLALFGVDLLFVWAVLTFVLNYIPNLGSVIAGMLPVLYALLTKDFSTALGVAAGLLVIEQVVGNYVDPRILGRQVVLSPFVILVALLFWTWLWGAVGAFLATPIMLSLLIAFNQVNTLRPIALMFSNQRTPEDLDDALEHD